MKNVKNIVLLCFFVLFCSQKSYSEDRMTDTVLQVSLENYTVESAKGLFQFDIYLEKISEMWHLWENATFQMGFYIDSSTQINYTDFDVEVDLTGSEIITSYTAQPVYHISAKTLEDRVVMMIMGPEDYFDAKQFEMMSKLKLGTVKLIAKNSQTTLPSTIVWKEPFNYYQATAYKYIEGVNLTPEYSIVPRESDHIEVGWITKFVATSAPPPTMRLDFFEVEYVSNLHTLCKYGTFAEFHNAGFVIKRGYVNALLTNDEYDALPDSLFTVTVGDYRLPEFEERMKGQIISYEGKKYDPIPDTIDYRVVNYVYRLFYERTDSAGLIKVATRNLVTPNSVITQATAFPNPCAGATKIDYVVDDDVYMTCEVYDQMGKKIKTLADNTHGLLDMTYVSAGKYIVDFVASELASQGLYDVVFIAYPINDKSVEISKATVKVQLVRGYAE